MQTVEGRGVRSLERKRDMLPLRTLVFVGERPDRRMIDSFDEHSAQLGLRMVLSVSEEPQGLPLESQTGVSDLADTGTEPTHQAGKAPDAREATADGRSIRLFNVIDDYNREGLDIEVGFSLSTARVIRALE